MCKKISVVGLGKLGVPIAVAYAFRGFHVVGIDVDTHKVKALNAGKSPVEELGVQFMLDSIPQGRLRATTDMRAVLDTDITIILVNTPLDPICRVAFSLVYLKPVCHQLGELLREKDYHIVVISSTVMPGVTGGVVRDILESGSGKRCGEDFGLCHCPEFLALGTAVKNILYPDFLLVGAHSTDAGEAVGNAMRRMCVNDPPIFHTSLVNAELAKLALNCMTATKITFANQWGMITEKYPGADVDVIMRIVGADSRVSPLFLRGSSWFGGPCLPRDIVAWRLLADEHLPTSALPSAMHATREMTYEHLINQIFQHLPAGGTLGVLGMSYKPRVGISDQSLGNALTNDLRSRVSIVTHDFLIDSDGTISIEDCVSQAQCIVIAVEDNRYRDWLLENREAWADKVVIDCWRLLGLEPAENYIPIGVGPLDNR